MVLTVLILLLVAYGVCLAGFLWSIATAPEAEEDETGFHLTKPGRDAIRPQLPGYRVKQHDRTPADPNRPAAAI